MVFVPGSHSSPPYSNRWNVAHSARSGSVAQPNRSRTSARHTLPKPRCGSFKPGGAASPAWRGRLAGACRLVWCPGVIEHDVRGRWWTTVRTWLAIEEDDIDLPARATQ